MADWDHIASKIRKETNRPFKLSRVTPMGGGSINQAACLHGTDGSRYFIKLNAARYFPMFAAEVQGLQAIATTKTLRVPNPITHDVLGDQSYLVLEYLELKPRGNGRLLGEQLAKLHRCTAEQYGFAQDNYIGTTLQPNGWFQDWIEFWRKQRLGFQLQLAEKNKFGSKLQSLGEELVDSLHLFFQGYAPPPSLLHGDLWGGNHGYLESGAPAIFDPASYYGDREADIAMTELFGGYPADFYAAYRAAWPLDAGYTSRLDLYNLYHILNHANLFGGGYAHQAETTMQRLLAQIY